MIELVVEVQRRLQMQCGERFAFVGGVAALPATGQMPPQFPAAYIVPLVHEPVSSSALSGAAQVQSFGFAVVQAVKHANDASGAKAMELLVAGRQAVVDALMGWTPIGAGAPITFTGGSLERVETGVVWWTDEFLTARAILVEPQS